MSAKITVSFIYQFYKSDEPAFNFLLDDILKCTNHTEIKFFIHKYEVENNIIKNIKFTKQGNNISQVTEKEYDVPDYHYDLLLAQNKWAKFLKAYGANENAEYNIAFFVQHSNGYGIRNDHKYLQSKSEFAIQTSVIENAIALYKNKKNLNGNIETGNYRLIPYFVLADAIEEAFNTKKIDLLFLNNCYSQTFEAGLTLSKNVSYLGSSQATLPGVGPNFKELFIYLEQAVNTAGKPTIKEIANNLVQNFQKKFSEKRVLDFLRTLEGNENKSNSELSAMANQHCFSINKLEKYPEILQHLNNIAGATPNTVLQNAICKIRERETDILCRDVFLDNKNELSLIDMYNLFEELQKLQPPVPLPNNFLQAINDTIIDKYWPDTFFNPPASMKIFKIMPHGISFFMPHTIEYNGNEAERKYSIGQIILRLLNKNIDIFQIQNSEWQNLIKTYATTTC
jgi:hypothetical protein